MWKEANVSTRTPDRGMQGEGIVHHHHHHVHEGLGVFPPEDQVGPSISSSVVLLVYIVTLILLFYLCPSSVRVVATFRGIVFYFLY
jgi:hypothetical protein